MSLLPLDGSKFRSEKHKCPLGSTYEQLRRLASAGDDFLAVNRSEVFICDSEWRLAPKTQPSCKRGWSDPPVASSEAPDKSSPHLLGDLATLQREACAAGGRPAEAGRNQTFRCLSAPPPKCENILNVSCCVSREGNVLAFLLGSSLSWSHDSFDTASKFDPYSIARARRDFVLLAWI